MSARFLAAGALGVLAACSAPPKPATTKRTAELAALPLFAVVEPSQGKVFVPLSNDTIAQLRLVCVTPASTENAASNELEVLVACTTLNATATCAAADGMGRIAIGLNDGSAELYDATKNPLVKLPDPLVVGSSPVAAIGLLATPPARDPASDPATAGQALTPAPTTAAFDALLALYPSRLRWTQSKGGGDTMAKPSLYGPAVAQGSGQEQHGMIHVEAIATDPIGRRWFLLADGAIHAVSAANAFEGFAPQRRCDANGAVAMAWTGRRLVLAGAKGVQWLDPETMQATTVPGSDSARFVHVVADDELGVVAGIDENDRVALWRNDAGTWRRTPVAFRTAARCLAIVRPRLTAPSETERAFGLGPQLLVLGASDDMGRGLVEFFDLAPPPVATP